MARVSRKTAFINVPYDSRYQDLYLAFIAGLTAFGLDPRATLEMDADDDCPAVLGPNLKARALPILRGLRVTVVIPKREFESWFLAAARSLAGRRGLREQLAPPENPEDIRGAKEWLSRNMIPGRAYSPTVDQAALVAGMD